MPLRYAYILFLLAYSWRSLGLAPSGPWDSFNLAPKSKTVYPAAIHSTHGAVTHANLLVNNAGRASLASRGSWIALDFGIEVSTPVL